MNRFLLIILALVLIAATALIAMHLVHRSSTKDLLAEMLSVRPEGAADTIALEESIRGLPTPVQRYFRMALPASVPAHGMVRIDQQGELMVAPGAEEYLKFTAVHNAIWGVPGFLWHAKIDFFPPLYIAVLDAYMDGTGTGKVLLQSTVPMGNRQDEPELNSGALYRYLAESVWYPPALLPANGVTWSEISENKALATLAHNGIIVSLEFTFNQAGEIESIYTGNRAGLFDGAYETYPWEGRFSDYRSVSGFRIPHYGEVGWHLPSGYWLFWKGHIVSANYE
ncbi:MAG: hypothetical protein CMN76_16960 [Spirochaetaceae bacterium]|nr:hypothetical protein [Spirochaetaceae bacterium]|tara:strand:+ start:15815 stop:16660 length:846 start_codon:yes stop_codon:yes gene_type:complete